jgi:amidase
MPSPRKLTAAAMPSAGIQFTNCSNSFSEARQRLVRAHLGTHVPTGRNFMAPNIIIAATSAAILTLSSTAFTQQPNQIGTAQAVSAQAPSRMFNPIEATIPQLQAALATGIITSRDLVTMYLARIEAYDQRGPALNAISVTNSKALGEADALDAERRAGALRGPLHGIPVVVKDNYQTIGMQTADGSLALAGWMPPDDAHLVKKLHAAGAIIIAKSNKHEFAAGWTTVGSLFGATRNPYALDRNPGGSSGGTGAAIAANLAAVGMGSDTCGSIRIPAAQNSLVGIRGTQGLASRGGIIPRANIEDIGGPIGRSVTDIAIVLDAIVGYDPADPQTAASVDNIPRSYADFLQLTGLRGARIGVVTAMFARDPDDAEVATVVRAAINEMKLQGADIVEVLIPHLAELLNDGNALIRQVLGTRGQAQHSAGGDLEGNG